MRQPPQWLHSRSQSLAITSCPSRIRHLSSSAPKWKKKDDIAEKQQEFQKEEVIDRRWTTQATLERTGRERWPWDHEITDPQIMVYDNGSVEGPLDTQFVLTKIAPHESLRMVTPYEPADPKKGTQQKYPLCKIVEKDAEYKKKKDLEAEKKKQKAKDKAAKIKEFEITWTSTDHDTANKVKHICAALAKGYSVTVTLSSKRKGKKQDLSGIDFVHVLNKAKEGIEAGGGKEKKAQDGELGETVKLFYEPQPAPKQ